LGALKAILAITDAQNYWAISNISIKEDQRAPLLIFDESKETKSQMTD
jgi:hypothetical protein